MSARATTIAALLLLAGCYDQPVANGFGATTPSIERPVAYNSTLGEQVAPVRIGELGPNFAACNAQGVVREAAAEGPIPVRAAPFEQARETGRMPLGTGFFICSRSLDQRWMGVVYDAASGASRGCGVSSPVPGRRDYVGPCESGWVLSAQVRTVAGVSSNPGETSRNDAQPR